MNTVPLLATGLLIGYAFGLVVVWLRIYRLRRR